MVVRTWAKLGRGGTLLKPKVTAGAMGASGPASAPFQWTTAGRNGMEVAHPVKLPPAATRSTGSPGAPAEQTRYRAHSPQPPGMDGEGARDCPQCAAQERPPAEACADGQRAGVNCQSQVLQPG